MQNITWSKLISPEDWQRLRRELVENQFPIPYSNGMAENRKTGYRMTSKYHHPPVGFKVGRLVIMVASPVEVPEEYVVSFLTRLFTPESR